MATHHMFCVIFGMCLVQCGAPCPRGTLGTGALSMRKSEENPGHREFPEGDPIQCHLERRGTWPAFFKSDLQRPTENP